MKAAIRKKYGTEEVIELVEMPMPQIKKNEILIKVHRSTVNRTDQGVLTGKPYAFRLFIGLTRPKREVLGTDFAGEVMEIGTEAKKFNVGDRVWGFYDEGIQSHAEYLVCQWDKYVTKIPEGIDFETAVASGEGAHYALNFLDKIDYDRDTKILVNGVTGAIGSAMIQILKSQGCQVAGVSNTKNMEEMRNYGIDPLFNYEKEDFTEHVRNYDMVLDAVGKSNFRSARKVLKPEGGYYISSELGPGAENLYLPLWTRFFSKHKVKFPLPRNINHSLEFMNQLMERNQYRPLLDQSFELDDITKAYAYMMTGQKSGNVILKVSS